VTVVDGERAAGQTSGGTAPAGGPDPDVVVVALYLPQFHPIDENDAWWGPGFTEWTNVARARRRYPGHRQPDLPADLGFYDLRVPDTRQAQADLARRHGVGAFCYWHYWFGGRRILERPFAEVLASGEPDFPFCLGWANQTWTGIWHGAEDRILVEQTYPGPDDHEAHLRVLLEAFHDRRYLRIDGKPLLYVYRPSEIPDLERTLDQFRSLAVADGLPGLHLVAERHGSAWDPLAHGFDDSVAFPQLRPRSWEAWFWRLAGRAGVPYVTSGARLTRSSVARIAEGVSSIPGVVPNWDNTPRSGAAGRVVHGATPERFAEQIQAAVARARERPAGRRLVFVKSWNEWAEGNHLEPDQRHGTAYLEAIAAAVRAPAGA
jgi:lipopolysaccharide biosynthesis protein